jgi:peptidoglycan/xylan/chitin deacetylase (PgdA/CDA1 family)
VLSEQAHDRGTTEEAEGRCLIPVLLYHAVGERGAGSDPLAVSRARFASHLRAIEESGRTALTVGEIAAGLRGELALPAAPVGITFDDADAATVAALEAMAALGLRASVYAIAGDLGTPAGLGAGELAALSALEGVELGAHSVSHPRLDELPTAHLAGEIDASKARLEDGIGEPVWSFAYPFGAFDPGVRAAVRAAGFRSAAAVKNAISHPGDDPWAIARWTVRRSTGAEEIAALLRGEGAPLSWSGERLRTRGYRIARRSWRRIARKDGR